MSKKALILVDLQNDFCPGGSLAVDRGDELIPLANQLQTHFDLVVATQDWHPEDHCSFAVNHVGGRLGQVLMLDGQPQILWPRHCVRGEKGADLHADLHKEAIAAIFHKGSDSRIDSYSAFFDNAHQRSTGLSDYLRGMRVSQVYIMGLATDYCVKYSALDAVHEGFETYVIADACRGVELVPRDIDRALAEMQSAGVIITSMQAVS